MKKKMILLMAVLLAFCWYTMVGSYMGREKNYQEAMDRARSFEERELYLDAIEEYKNAMRYREDTTELMLKSAYAYRDMGDEQSYLSELKNVVAAYGPGQEALKGIYDYYQAQGREDSAIEYIVELKKKYPQDALVEQYYRQIRKSYYELYYSYQQIGEYLGKYAVYGYEGKKGIIDAAGEIVLEAAYDDIRVPLKLSDGIPVRDGDKVYFISEKGYKTAQPDGSYDGMGIRSDNRILVEKDGKFGYLDRELNVKMECIWEDATNFSDKTAAVKSGGRWALINTKGEFLTDYIYTDVKRDAHNFCSQSGLIWVNDGKGYRLADTELEAVCEDVYEDVRCFYEDYAAVLKNGRWGFIDRSGQMVIAPAFEDADSFTLGYAPVRSGGFWGYIGDDGKLLIDCAFDGAGRFNGEGSAPVKREGSWELIKLSIYE